MTSAVIHTTMRTGAPDAAHLVFLLYGSRGDVQPGLCLALESARRGHRVTVAVPPNLVPLATAAGVGEVVPIGADTDRQWTSDEALDAQRSAHPLRQAKFAIDTARAGIAAFDDAMMTTFLGDDPTITGVDALIAAPLCQARGLAVAERLGVPLTVLRYAPMSENALIGPIPGVTDGWTPQWTRRAWRIHDGAVWSVMRHGENRFRQRAGLRPVRTSCAQRLNLAQIPQIQAYDPGIVPGLAEQWRTGPSIKPVVGFLDLPSHARATLDETSGADADLVRWLDAGEPPLFVGFGSMPIADPAATRAMIAAAARRHGMRCVFAVGGRSGAQGVSSDSGVSSGADESSDSYDVAAVNHSWLLPRCSAVVHHGGAGTTAAGLRAGIPAIVYSFTAEQPFWAGRIADLGLGTGRRFTRLTAETMFDDLTVARSESVRTAAAAFAATMIISDRAVRTAADIVDARLLQGVAG